MGNLTVSNNEAQIFNFTGSDIRLIMIDGEPWFVAKDVCDVLGIKSRGTAVGRLNSDEKQTICLTDTLSRNPKMSVVNEPGLYALVGQSRKPEAKAFQHWVNHEVLPSIRKTGGYVANDNLFIETYLPFADEQTKVMFRATLETVRKQNEHIAMLKPKADYFDVIVDRNLLTNFRDTAKEFKMGQKEFINWLLDDEYIYRDKRGQLKPFMQYVPSLFEIKESGNGHWAGTQTLITPLGRNTFLKELKQERTLVPR